MPKIGPNLNIDYILVCDDIRQENNGKQILIGVYKGAIIVPEFPARLLLALLLRGTANQTGSFPFEMRFVFDGGSVLTTGSGNINVRNANELLSVAIQQIPIEFKDVGKFKLQMREPGARWKTVQETEIQQQSKNG